MAFRKGSGLKLRPIGFREVDVEHLTIILSCQSRDLRSLK